MAILLDLFIFDVMIDSEMGIWKILEHGQVLWGPGVGLIWYIEMIWVLASWFDVGIGYLLHEKLQK